MAWRSEDSGAAQEETAGDGQREVSARSQNAAGKAASGGVVVAAGKSDRSTREVPAAGQYAAKPVSGGVRTQSGDGRSASDPPSIEQNANGGVVAAVKSDRPAREAPAAGHYAAKPVSGGGKTQSGGDDSASDPPATETASKPKQDERPTRPPRSSGQKAAKQVSGEEMPRGDDSTRTNNNHAASAKSGAPPPQAENGAGLPGEGVNEKKEGKPEQVVEELFTPISDRFLSGIVAVLQSFVTANSSAACPDVQTVFHSRSVPAISIEKYVHRIAKYVHCQEEDFVISLILVDRLLYNLPTCRLSYHTFHRLFLASIVLAIKSRQDFYFSNAYYAQVGGASLQELNALEHHFLVLIDFDLYVDRDMFVEFVARLQECFDFGQC
ncbi:hypothetical protein DIPPA_14383 [Diplonema papillatum]|nr:hypothetical protein DIPPA_14383 [Diplonema papillatum]